MPALNDTHDPKLKSWVASANDGKTDFPIQNLPFGVFRRGGRDTRHVGVAIGDQILDLAAAADAGLLGNDPAVAAVRAPVLNPLLALGRTHWSALRTAISAALRQGGAAQKHADKILVAQKDVEMALPMDIGDYTDFFLFRAHAENAGRILGRADPLMPNYRYIPVGYHGRASSIAISGTPLKRPSGQTMGKGANAPSFGPTRRLDYEAEIGVVIGPGNAMGRPIPLAEAENHVFGVCMLNDWSARDMQAWEYQPLGPFLAKSSLTTIAPWIVTLEALAPFRTARLDRGAEPAPLPYLDSPDDQSSGALDFDVEVWLETAAMRTAGKPPHRLSRGRFRGMYWTVFQMVAHHTSNGCNLRPGDLLGSGTISNGDAETRGCLLERSWGGTEPIALDGETRTFLEDGDRVIFRGAAEKNGVHIGFGVCEGTVQPA